MSRYSFIVALLCLAAHLSSAAITARHVKSDSDNYPLVITSVQVLNSSDEPYTDLTEKNFKLSVDDKPVDSLSVTTYEKTGEGVFIMLCIDASGSMRGEPIETVKKAVLPFIDRLRSVDKVAISIYADDYELLADFTDSKQLLASTVKGISPRGSYTSLYYGADKALEELINLDERAGKILVLMGDGKDENPTRSYQENDVIGKAKENNIPIFTIGYTKVEEIYLQSLERMAVSTGGNYYYAPGADELKEHFEKLYRQIMNINLLSYTVVGVAGDGNEHNLGIIVKTDQGTQQVNAKLKTPTGIEAVEPSEKAAKEDSGINPLLLIIIAAAALMLALAVFLILRAAKKARLKREEEIRNIEARKNSELEAERQKLQILENEMQQKRSQSSDNTQFTGPSQPSDRPRDRTMILGAGSGAAQQPAPSTGYLKLEVLFGSNQGKTFSIDKQGSTIGRASDNQIVFPDKTVSSHHARIYYTDGYYVIEDLGSMNGTYINGNKIQIYRIEGACTFKMGSEEGNIILF